MTYVYLLPEFRDYCFAISNVGSKPWVMRTHVHSLQRPNLKSDERYVNKHASSKMFSTRNTGTTPLLQIGYLIQKKNQGNL
jgi:hypothetical protein